ncbi:F-box incomplete domain containing protein [Pandoravirus japonicus]|uniref:F-box incomplete domain containing protein n=1 Tax=Pandoravirus japonicus TaxID=2823154 RepID=A0A811BR39_9VIRU|nr:F-box incomplete domain containing protein [Pandoravirus japonicus]
MSRRDSRCAWRNAGASLLSRLPDDILARILVDGLDDHHRRVAALACRRWRAVIITAMGAGANLRVDARTQGLLAADGCLGVLVWLAERVPRGDTHWHPIARGAAAHGHLHVLDWAASEVSRAYLDEALPHVAAARAGRVDVLAALDQRGHRDLSGAAACTAAVACGHLDCAAWLLARGATLDYRAACEHAVAACDIGALAWLCDLARDHPESGYDWDPVALMGLASRVGISAWLLERARAADAATGRRERQRRTGHRDRHSVRHA